MTPPSSEQSTSIPPAPSDACAESKRVDGPFHSWEFDGDDPYIVCFYCGERRDALTGRVIKGPRF